MYFVHNQIVPWALCEGSVARATEVAKAQGVRFVAGASCFELCAETCSSNSFCLAILNVFCSVQCAWRGHVARKRRTYLWKERKGIIADENARILQKVIII